MSRCYACPKNLGNGGILTENGRLLCEHAIIYRKGVPKKVLVDTWHDAKYGYSGSSVIKKSAQEGLTSLADSLANLYLSSNPRN